MATRWTSKIFKDLKHFYKLGNPRVFAQAFGLKVPLMYCANENCIYLKYKRCPAGAKYKKKCPNVSKFDYKSGCQHYIGRPYQHHVLSESFNADKMFSVMITGRGTGKSAIINTQKALMECTVMPYIRALLYRSDKPVPTKAIIVGNTKDTALLLNTSINHALRSNELLSSFVDPKSWTKTYIRFLNGSEIYVKTLGTDGRGCRGFHADVMKNAKKEDIKTTILVELDEGCFARAPTAIKDVLTPTLQVGNVFSHFFITSTPWSKNGEVYNLAMNPGELVKVYNFSAYHNKFTNLRLLADFRKRLDDAGAAGIYNREVLGMFESDEGLFFPFEVWAKSIDESLDWMEYEKIEQFDKTLPGNYYLGIDPNKFRQLQAGDFSAYILLAVSGNRKHIRTISRGKYKMDLEDKFLDRISTLVKIFRPKVICDMHSGYVAKLKNIGIDVRSGKNDPTTSFNALSLMKLDMVHGILRQPPCHMLEDERRTYIVKDPDTSVNIPVLDHKGEWGQGYTSDLLDSYKYAYQGIMEDFGIVSIGDIGVVIESIPSINRDYTSVINSNIAKVNPENDRFTILGSSAKRLRIIKR